MKDYLYDLNELIEKLEYIRENTDGTINHPRTLLTLSYYVKELKEKGIPLRALVSKPSQRYNTVPKPQTDTWLNVLNEHQKISLSINNETWEAVIDLAH